jgi:tripartite-type tricarboxylate transporter receptor subunit TctC
MPCSDTKLNSAIQKCIDEQAFRKRLEGAANEFTLSTPEEFAAFVRSEKEK